MGTGATIRTLSISLSDVDRGVYEALELRLAQHPSESLSFFWSRILSYCLSYEEGIRFSKEGLFNAEEAPVAVFRADGTMACWVDVGAPSAERLHKASKAADRVLLYSAVNMTLLRQEAARRRIHRVDSIEVWSLPPELLEQLGARTGRNMSLELARTDNQLYITFADALIEATVTPHRFEP